MESEKTLDLIFARPDLMVWTFFGAFLLYALNKLNAHQPFSLFKVLNFDLGTTAKARIILLDMFISSIIGAIAVFCLTSPSTAQQAMAAGLGMTGILSAAAKGK